MRLSPVLALVPFLLLWPAAPQAPPTPSFTIRIVTPSPLYLVGRCRVRAEAVDAEGKPYDRVAWMTLSFDGVDLGSDSRPPFEWEFDAGGDLRPRRVEVQAHARDGTRATLALLSSAHRFVEAVGVNLVLVPVVVREGGGEGRPGRPVRGLKAGDFTVLEDGAPRAITSFSDEPLPGSIAVGLDNSVSMERDLWSARKAIAEFARAQPPWTALSLMTFNDQVFMERDFTYDAEEIAAAAAESRAEGTRTALFDALRIGSLHLARRAGSRVLVLFTDGEDTVYEADPGRLRTALDAAQGADVTVFAVAYGPRQAPSLAQMTRGTGGEVVAAGTARELRDAFARITESLGSRYVLGYEPPDPGRPGHRSIEVRVSRPGLDVLARRGYLMK